MTRALAVERTREFERVRNLPRREISEDEGRVWAEALRPDVVEDWSSAALNPWQGLALKEAPEVGGAFLVFPVGLGKTIMTLTLPTVFRSKRPILVGPASLEDKTWAEFESYFQRGWRRFQSPLRYVSPSWLFGEEQEDWLFQYAPDLVMIDECDDLQNVNSAVRRLDRYKVARPDVPYVAMTATPIRLSLMGIWHILCWTLGPNAPVPLDRLEAEMWARAVDAKPRFPASPGPLGATREQALDWLSDRICSTPGVLIVDVDSCDQPLTVRQVLAREDPDIDAVYDNFREFGETPEGLPLENPLEKWALDNWLGLGLYPRWDPAPPEEWRVAKRAVAALCRDSIEASQGTSRPLDTVGQVLRRYRQHPAVEQWLRVKGLFDESRRVPVWFSRSGLDSVHDWLDSLGDEPGIVWCGCVPFAEALARETGLEYYGAGAKSANGLRLHDAPLGKLIASWPANKKGLNLQNWQKQLIVAPPQSGKWLEQIFGRMHRQGQEKPVFADYLVTSGGTARRFEEAIQEARWGRHLIRTTQKILRSEVIRAYPARTPTNEFRWLGVEQLAA